MWVTRLVAGKGAARSGVAPMPAGYCRKSRAAMGSHLMRIFADRTIYGARLLMSGQRSIRRIAALAIRQRETPRYLRYGRLQLISVCLLDKPTLLAFAQLP